MSKPTHVFAADAFGPGLKPDVMVIGAERETMSRSKARKLAYQFKGGNRSKRYKDFLNGVSIGFWVQGKRLVRPPKFAKTTMLMKIHAEGSSHPLGTGDGGAYSLEDPIEYTYTSGKP